MLNLRSVRHQGSFVNATATEVVIALQFGAPLAGLNALQIADLVGRFPEFPRFTELPLSGPMPYSLGQLQGSEPVDGFVANFPRIGLGSNSGDRTLSFQADRLTYSWVRTSEIGQEDDYPGFDELLKEFEPLVARFVNQLLAMGLENLTFKVAEITYVNVIPTRTKDNDIIKLSSLFAFMRPALGWPPINGYWYSWNERLGVADGVLQVQVNGPVVYAPEKPAASFSLTGAFLITDHHNLNSELLAVRERMGETYRRVLSLEGSA
jgi:uncharacterized protein (TIGR04255 family)